MTGTTLQAVRKLQGYSVAEVIRMLLRRADTLNIPIMSATSLKTKISRWENGHEQLSQPYRRLFRDIYGRTNEELGFPAEPEDEQADELLARLAVARTIDPATVEIFRHQIDNARHVDRRFGAITILDQLRCTIKQMENLLGYSTSRSHRELLAAVLTQACALAGWEALDRNAIRQAWDHHERAKAAALEAASPPLFVHSIAQQAFILLDIGEVDAAVEQLEHARRQAEHSTPALLRSWLAAAHGEGLAVAGRRDDALRAFDTAGALLPADPEDPALPFLFLGGAHLDRWRGHALARLGERDAIEHLSHALPRLPASFVRARTSMLVDLAYAHATAGDRDTALEYARQAKRLASQIKSDRQLRRLAALILPLGHRNTS